MKKISKKVISLILSVLMVASVLPSFAVTAMAADKVTYEFDAFSQASGVWSYEGGSENGQSYNVFTTDGGDAGYSRTGSGLATFNRGCLFLNDDTVNSYVHNGVFTVEFTGKVDSTDQTYTLMGIAINKDGGELFRLESNGDIVVNNAVVENIAINSTVMADYAVSYDKNTFKVYVNGTEKASIDAEIDYANAGYVSLGWTDRCGHAKSIATYDMVSVSNGAFDSADYLATQKERATANNSVKTGNAVGRFYNYETPGYYSNLIYCNNDVVWSGNGSSDTTVTLSNINYKICFPSNVVMMYDGKTAPSFPAKMECKSTDTGKTRCYVYIDSAKDYLTFKKNWIMNTKAWDNWDLSVTEDTTGYSSDNRLRSNENQAANKNTSRFWYNNACYNVDLDNNTTYVKFTDVAFTCHLNSNWDETYVDTHNTVNNNRGQFYVVNYKPIADIYEDVKAKVAEVAKNDSTYGNLGAFYATAGDILNLDPNAGCYDYTNHTEYAVQNVASSIKNAVEAYNLAVANLVDKSALAAAITVAETVTADEKYEVKYTEASRTAFESALADAKTVLETEGKTQDEVNTATSALEEAQNSLALAAHSVTVNVINADTGAKIIDSISEQIADGEEYLYRYDIPVEEEVPTYVFYKWTKTVEGKTTRLNNTDTALDEIIKNDAEYTLYLLPSSAAQGDLETSTTTRVRFLDKANRTIDISTADRGTAITAESFGVEAPAVAFYGFTGWECLYGNPNYVTDVEVVFKATYAFNSTEANMCNIVSKDASVKVNGAASAKVGYDTLVTLTGADAYAYCDAEGNIISAINGTTIYAPHKATIYVTKVETVQPASATVTGYFCSETKMQGATPYKTLTVNSQYYVPAEATASECGIMVSRDEIKWTKVKSTVQGTNHEYSIAMNYSSPYKLKVKAYVVVGEDTFESDVEEIQLDAID